MDMLPQPSSYCTNPLVKKSIEFTELYWTRNETGNVSFIVDSVAIRAHHYVLAALSPKYKDLYNGEIAENHIIDIVDNVSAPAFEEFLQFFYLEEFPLTLQNINGVLALAKQSLVEPFVDACVKSLIEMTTVDNLCWIYTLAIVHNLDELCSYCEKEIRINAGQVFQSSSFVACYYDVLCYIIQMDDLCCKESEVFQACIKWGSAACKTAKLDETTVNLRSLLGDVIYEVRLYSMGPMEFEPFYHFIQNFFTAAEYCEIMLMIAKDMDYQPQLFNATLRQPISNEIISLEV